LIFPEFDPVIFEIGPIVLRWYAMAYVAGIVLGWWYAGRLIRRASLWSPSKPPLSPIQLDDLVMWITLGIILGGRLGYALFYRPEMYGQLFTGDTLGERFELFQLWTGGMSFHGGLIGTTLAVILYSRAKGLRVLSVGDMALATAPIGLFFGRLANFINGELWGRPTDAPWGVNFCNETTKRLYESETCQVLLANGMIAGPGDVARHPSQLYEAGLEGLLLFALLAAAVWAWKLLSKPGYVTGLFLLGYGLSRAALETVRQPDLGFDHLPFGLTMGMMLSTPMILVGAWLIWRAWSRPPATN
jgi:phosphatidylglycerol:prolipoprotein diacylglycerol transferase